MIIRTIPESDAAQFLNLCKQLDAETQFMMLEPGERKTTLEEQRAQIDILLRQENQTIFVAEQDNQLVGYLARLGSERGALIIFDSRSNAATLPQRCTTELRTQDGTRITVLRL